MRIVDLITPGSPAFSFEFFPPKSEASEENLFLTIAQLETLRPAFVSVTCGAGGSQKGKTVAYAERIYRDHGIDAVVHLTCLGQSRADLEFAIDDVRARGLTNILALRGDQPRHAPAITTGCRYAVDLVRTIRDRHPDSCILAACYPETHPEAESAESDIRYLGEKVAAGVDVLVSQLFFDNSAYFEFVERCRAAGIQVPIVPGIMPITNVDQIEKFTRMCGAGLPARLLNRLDSVRSDPQEVFAAGVEHAIDQCLELLQSGAPGIHFYTLNRSPATRLVVQALRRQVG